MKKLCKKDKFAKSLVHLACVMLAAAMMLSILSIPSAGANTVPFDDPDAALGSDISSFSTTDITGAAVTGSVLNEHRLNIIHYFAVWSPDCVREMGYMQSVQEEHQSELRVFGLLYEDSESTPEHCLELMNANGYGYTVLRKDPVLSELVSEYPMIPQTFFVNMEGIVVEHFPGRFESIDQLEEMIETQLNSPVFHTVTFFDNLTGDLICRVNVAHGESAVPPEPPVHPRYHFIGWIGNYEHVTEDRTIRAEYEADPILLGDVDMDGRITVTDALSVLRAAMGISCSNGVLLYGDINGDGSISATDAMIILRIALDII